jgi:hypothetical protein
MVRNLDLRVKKALDLKFAGFNSTKSLKIAGAKGDVPKIYDCLCNSCTRATTFLALSLVEISVDGQNYFVPAYACTCYRRNLDGSGLI